MDRPLQATDFAQLRAFVMVAEQLSFSRAAELLGVSPSALSQSIRGLEERVGVRLLNRTTRSVALTPPGEALLGRLAPALGAVTEAVAGLERLSGRPAGTVRVIASRWAARIHIAPMLAVFHDEYPDVVIDLTVDDSVADLVAGGFDAALRPGEVIEKDMIAVRVGPDHRQVACAAPAYLDRQGRPQTPDDLTAHACLRWRWAGRKTPYAWEFYRDGRWFEVVVDGPLIVDDRPVMIRAAIDGMGIAFTTESEIARHVAEGRLVPLLKDWTEPFPGYFLCYPRQRHMAPALRAFIDVLRRS